MTPRRKANLYQLIEELLQADVIQPSQSNFSSTPVIVERPNKHPRFCIDYRQVNATTTDEPSTLLLIQENLRDISSRIFSLIQRIHCLFNTRWDVASL